MSLRLDKSLERLIHLMIHKHALEKNATVVAQAMERDTKKIRDDMIKEGKITEDKK